MSEGSVKSGKICIKAQSFDAKALDRYVVSVVSVASSYDGYVIGPIPLPLKSNKFVINTSKTIEKTPSKIREKQRRILYILDENSIFNIVKEVAAVKIPNGVGVEIKVES